jgi:DNA polymerase-3 subunit delta
MPLLSALDYLEDPAASPPAAVCVLFGDEPFLKRLALARIRQAVLGDQDGEFSLARFDGRQTPLRDVLDELSTVALFGSGRLVVVEDADEFVTRYRPELEDYVARPKPSGTLVLDVAAWAKTTRLYKALAHAGLSIDCKAPEPGPLVKWLVAWARRQHQARLEGAAADLLLEMVGPQLGLLDQELAKLAASVGPGGAITADLVGELAGGWRARTAWEMIDAANAGNARAALNQLDRLLAAGEAPVGILAQMAASLRRFAAATRLVEQAEAAGRPIKLAHALAQAGVNPYVLRQGLVEKQLMQIGRQRAAQLYRWVLAADLDLKGASQLPPRMVLERLIARLSSTAGQAARARRLRHPMDA